MDETIEGVVLFIGPRWPIIWNSEAVGFVFTGFSASFAGLINNLQASAPFIISYFEILLTQTSYLTTVTHGIKKIILCQGITLKIVQGFTVGLK